MLKRWPWFVFMVGLGPSCWGMDGVEPVQAKVSFSQHIAPVLIEQCQGCHGARSAKGKYRVDTFARLLEPRNESPEFLISGDAEKSEFFRRLVTDDLSERMPKDAPPLLPERLESMKQWISEGAAYDGDNVDAPLWSLLPPVDYPVSPESYPFPEPVRALARHPGEAVVVTGGLGEVLVWDTDGMGLGGRIGGMPTQVMGLDFSPDGTYLAVSGGLSGLAGEIFIVDWSTRSLVAKLGRTSDLVLGARFDSGGKVLVSSGTDGVLRVYSAIDFSLIRQIEAHVDWILDFSFHPSRNWVATASRDKTAKVFDWETGNLLAVYPAHQNAVLSVAWDGDRGDVWSSGKDGRLRRWSVENPDKDAVVEAGGTGFVRLMVLGGVLYGGGMDGQVWRYSMESRKKLEAWKGYSAGIWAMAQGGSGTELWAGSLSGDWAQWRVEPGEMGMLRKNRP